jgi:hypothetical protein
VTRTRIVVIWASLGVAVVAWTAMLVLWAVIGSHVGHQAGFIFAAAVAATGTIVCAQTIVMPDSQRMYALGWRDRGKECECTAVERDGPPLGTPVEPVDDVAAARARHPSAADRQAQAREANR